MRRRRMADPGLHRRFVACKTQRVLQQRHHRRGTLRRRGGKGRRVASRPGSRDARQSPMEPGERAGGYGQRDYPHDVRTQQDNAASAATEHTPLLGRRMDGRHGTKHSRMDKHTHGAPQGGAERHHQLLRHARTERGLRIRGLLRPVRCLGQGRGDFLQQVQLPCLQVHENQGTWQAACPFGHRGVWHIHGLPDGVCLRMQRR